jgi:hypothetical protein
MQWPKDKRINNGPENTTQTTDTNDTYPTKHLGELRCSGREAARMTRTPLNIWVNSDATEERQHE